MDKNNHSALLAIQYGLNELLCGNHCDILDIEPAAKELQTIMKQINQLSVFLKELNCLSLELSQGNVNGPIPSRHNYMASSLKQLHSQLSSLMWGMRQLSQGYVVGKLEGEGELIHLFNELVDRVVTVSTQKDGSDGIFAPITFNSWRYHQIMKTLDMLHVAVIEVNDSTQVVYTNKQAKLLFGNVFLLIEQVESDVLKFVTETITDKGNDIKYPISCEIYEECKSTWYRVTIDRFLFPTGQAFYYNTMEDISEWKNYEHQLKKSAMVDEMTGTYNRKTGLEQLDKIIMDTEPSNNCIVFIDIDRLKLINDNYGHAEGDFTIRSIAKVILSSLRDSDLIFRYGGDEFLIIFRNCCENYAEKVINRIYSKLKNLNEKIKKPYILSFSYGIVSFTNDRSPRYSATELLELADQKMYQCKYNKRERK